MTKTKKNVDVLIVFLLVLCIILPIIIISIYNHPSADDFSYSYVVKHLIADGQFSIGTVIAETVGFLKENYNTNDGPYSISALLVFAQPTIYSEKLYAIVSIINICLIFYGTYFFIKKILKIKDKNMLIASMLISLYIIEQMPSPVEGLFWFSGAVNYTGFFFLFLIDWALLYSLINSTKYIVLKTFLLSLLSFFVVGGNHLLSVLCFIFFMALIIFAVLKKKYRLIAPCVCAVFGFLLSNFSGGTAKRLEHYSMVGRPSFFKALYEGFFQLLRNMDDWFSLALFCMLLILLPLFINIHEKNEALSFSLKKLLFIVVGTIALLGLEVCIPYYAMGYFGEGRVQDFIFYTFCFCMFGIWYYLLGGVTLMLKTYNIKYSWNKKIYCLIIMGVLFVGFWGNKSYSTSIEAVRELVSGEAKQYDAEWDERIILYSDDNKKNVVVSEFSVKPKLLFFSDVSNDKNDWRNFVLARFYNKSTVEMK
ncbi:MAG: hypothetical protein NC393_02410 [Clostridium sp.]|nr:hypothetical protein [Clostridium sp.]